MHGSATPEILTPPTCVALESFLLLRLLRLGLMRSVWDSSVLEWLLLLEFCCANLT